MEFDGSTLQVSLHLLSPPLSSMYFTWKIKKCKQGESKIYYIVFICLFEYFEYNLQ